MEYSYVWQNDVYFISIPFHEVVELSNKIKLISNKYIIEYRDGFIKNEVHGINDMYWVNECCSFDLIIWMMIKKYINSNYINTLKSIASIIYECVKNEWIFNILYKCNSYNSYNIVIVEKG